MNSTENNMTGIHESSLKILTFAMFALSICLKKYYTAENGDKTCTIICVEALLLAVEKWEEPNCSSIRAFFFNPHLFI